jgi:hypothetical protein
MQVVRLRLLPGLFLEGGEQVGRQGASFPARFERSQMKASRFAGDYCLFTEARFH